MKVGDIDFERGCVELCRRLSTEQGPAKLSRCIESLSKLMLNYNAWSRRNNAMHQ